MVGSGRVLGGRPFSRWLDTANDQLILRNEASDARVAGMQRRTPMSIKILSAVAVVTAAFAVPAFAQQQHHHHVRAASYHGPAYAAFRGAYNRLPMNESYDLEGIRAGPVCPGIARSIDCSIWPPPIDEDPDRKRGGGGGG